MWPLFLVIMSPIHNHAGEDGQGAERLAGAIRQLHGHEGRLSNFAAAAAPSTTTTTVAIMGFASTAVGRQTVRGSRWMLCGCVGLCGWGGGGGHRVVGLHRCEELQIELILHGCRIRTGGPAEGEQAAV